MKRTIDTLWYAWAAKFAEIVDAMDLRFDDREHGEGYLGQYYHVTPEDEYLQVITSNRSDDVIEVVLYGANRSPSPVSSLSLRGGELRVSTGGTFHRIETDAAPDLVEFLKRMRKKAVEYVPPPVGATPPVP
ncbi:hypothetical protein OIU34_23935 [Pararhizobium sp. BT-229]|uniref:hypothetical protein n=1 Tax=Pararhizobium sp. BT-229 TaxID=2986923 RepID=UPI0021F7FF2E|nr:hypothetical protein [Pararhizobium sp. BT-229]MCV9964949.1 hypothetical protein [Pararhizobium sp. BT-229]